MKKIFILVFAVFLSTHLLADCMAGGIRVFPDNFEICKNSIIVLEGHIMSQKTIKSLKLENRAYLNSGNHRVQLKVINLYEGEDDLTQAILKPQEELKVGQEYTLELDSLGDDDHLYKIGKYNQPISWKVINKVDTKKPSWKSGMRPKFQKTSFTAYGCGPAVYAHFRVSIHDKSETLVKTEVMDLSNKERTIFYLSPRDGVINVGHGMCSGAFVFRENVQYKIRFDLMDASGNSFGRWSEWTKVDGFQTKMGYVGFSKNNLLLQIIGIGLLLIAFFIKRYSIKL